MDALVAPTVVEYVPAGQLEHLEKPVVLAKVPASHEMHMDAFSALDYESRIQAELMTRPDFKEGYKAFLEKRRPRFDGAPE